MDLQIQRESHHFSNVLLIFLSTYQLEEPSNVSHSSTAILQNSKITALFVIRSIEKLVTSFGMSEIPLESNSRVLYNLSHTSPNITLKGSFGESVSKTLCNVLHLSLTHYGVAVLILSAHHYNATWTTQT